MSKWCQSITEAKLPEFDQLSVGFEMKASVEQFRYKAIMVAQRDRKFDPGADPRIPPTHSEHVIDQIKTLHKIRSLSEEKL